jgi:CarD family transcriptional regulator
MATAKKAAGKTAAKKSNKKLFKAGQFIVYPAHGVGKVTGIEQDVIAGFDIETYVVHFEQDKMTLRVPTTKAANSGMRALSNELILKDAFTTLKGRARIKRTMWSRRAQEYEAKINSGDAQPEQSYSERQLYERATDRMVREVAAIKKTDRSTALDEVLETLTKARTRQAAKAAKEAEKTEGDEGEATAAA